MKCKVKGRAYNIFDTNCYALKYFIQWPLLRISISLYANMTTNGGHKRGVGGVANDTDNPN